LKDLENRTTTGLAAMDLLAALAAEKEAAMKGAAASGLSTRAFSVYWTLKNDETLKPRTFRRWIGRFSDWVIYWRFAIGHLAIYWPIANRQ
jgi:hypothetical protein